MTVPIYFVHSSTLAYSTSTHWRKIGDHLLIKPWPSWRINFDLTWGLSHFPGSYVPPDASPGTSPTRWLIGLYLWSGKGLRLYYLSSLRQQHFYKFSKNTHKIQVLLCHFSGRKGGRFQQGRLETTSKWLGTGGLETPLPAGEATGAWPWTRSKISVMSSSPV